MAKAELSFNGQFDLELSSDLLEAWLVFKSGNDADKPWALPEIMAIFSDAKLNVKTDEVQKLLAGQFQKKESAFRLLVAKGTAPTPPVPEELKDDYQPVPNEWKEALTAAIAEASPPELTQDVQVRVEREKVIQKKGVLPFFHGKEEKVKVIEKETKQEKVWVDTNVLAYGYVEASGRVGQILASKPSVPGKNVRGEVINLPLADNVTFYAGQNITRKGADLLAEMEGIVRVGKNWVDILPFSAHSWSLDVSDDKATLYLNFFPGSKHLGLPQAKDILLEAEKLGFAADTLFPESDIQNSINESFKNSAAIEHHPITLPEDAFFEVTISSDNLKAVLNASKGSGKGKALVLKDVGRAINESKVKLTDREKVKVDILAFVKSKERTLIGYMLGEGRAPVAAPPQTAAFSADFLEGKRFEELKKQFEVSPPREIGGFPITSIDGLAFAEKEQRILTLGPVVVGNPGVDVFGKSLPGIPSPEVVLHLSGKLERLSLLVVAKQAGLLLKAEVEGNIWLALIEHQDARFKIELSDDKMLAWLTVEGHRGSGKQLDPQSLKKAVETAGIKKGILVEVLDKAIEAAVTGQDIEKICIAEGKAPVAGAASSFRFLVEFASGHGVSIRADGSADFRNQDKITTVKAGTQIAEMLPPDHQPDAGFDVTGKEISPPAVSNAEYVIGNGIKQEPQTDGRILLTAETDGELKKEKGKLEIVPAFIIKGNVDTTTGNIKFPGAVQVSGDVATGFFIMAGGDIKVAGSVEGALLSSDQDIVLNGGIKGLGKGLLRSKRNIFATYIEQATVLGIGDIKVKKAIFRSKIKCNGHVLLPDDAHIIGGEIKVKSGIITGTLGSDRGVPTRIFFGQDILVEDQIETEAKEITKLQAEIAQVNKVMQNSEKLTDKVALQELFNKKVQFIKLLDKRNLRLFTLKERWEQHFPSEIVVKGTVFPGVVFESHGRTYEILAPKQRVRITFDTDSGRIIELPLDAKSS